MGSGTIQVEGGHLYYEESGAGGALVLLHEGILDSRMFDPQFEAFAARYRTVRYDIRGYGRSSRPEGPYSDADDLGALLDELGIDRAGLVALSMGGAIAIEFTLTHPSRVAALVLGASGVRGFDTSAELDALYAPAEAAFEAGDIRRAAEIELSIWARKPTDPVVDERIHEIAMDNAHQVALDGSLRIRMEPPAIERLGEIAAPTLVLVGDEDVPDMLRIAELLATSIPGARSAVLGGADHVLNMRRPEEFNRLTLEFLSETLLS